MIQAEDGIRDLTVTGVQTCALPILSWRCEFMPELRAEGYSRMTYELEPMGDSVKLTVIHEMDRDDSKFIESVSSGWPSMLASLKSRSEERRVGKGCR